MSDVRELEEYVKDNDIRFIRLTFFDVFGEQRNIAIMPQEIRRAAEEGIAFDAGAIPGFDCGVKSDLFLEPDFSTMTLIPWRSMDGGVVRVFCGITYPDGRPFEKDPRYILKKAMEKADEAGISVEIGTEVEFYIFRSDENGQPTKIPHDQAGYFAVSPKDKGENIRREICQILYEMGITPEASHHEQGPGQHEVDFRYGDPLQAADNTATFKWIVENAVLIDGCHADFSPKPLADKPGNGMHIHISVHGKNNEDVMPYFMEGVMEHIQEMTVFLNPQKDSYARLGLMEAPSFISWSDQNRSQLIRVPANRSGKKRFELRSPDPCANPYLAYALLIHAGLDGIERKLALRESVDENLYRAPSEITEKLQKLPASLDKAADIARESAFIKEILPEDIIDAYCDR